ncbi:hypothetical protein B0A58_07305 [Flavobacterium branchiophilum NBRC 15030 = ATCC 35035]|uniref:Uncharacterized protein n=1 Tax=Flavobacterium branchiophilum TaxID=55197 RepID=A0A543G158_9FLAO|nr:hypothetical protein [Flavobacterium branchiophilum]OXA76372.1 hypothetical protein B0A58_07305 [Flavobacterium branchiophilum NBRC 15030 = ATCC 35035]TQM39807.1 hypothetical protein BC670_0639 [Flavobacterium branchiophilum]GEM55269.1 hypothetical protein FB1_14900 [Flavobacterium branchiophilum NBRC 15030 = ATCC 35035]
MTKKEHQRRYRLHAKVRIIVHLESRKRTIYVPTGYETQNKHILELIHRFQYNVQFEIPNDKQ